MKDPDDILCPDFLYNLTSLLKMINLFSVYDRTCQYTFTLKLIY